MISVRGCTTFEDVEIRNKRGIKIYLWSERFKNRSKKESGTDSILSYGKASCLMFTSL